MIDDHCSRDDCLCKPAYKGADLCRKHYDQRTDKRDYFQGSLDDRMWHYTDLSDPFGCWLWTGTQRKGYGLVWLGPGDGQREAHIVAWELEHSELAEGRPVRHSCDTPLCVRGAHLLIGTHADNVQDKVDRERQDRGSKHGMAKLTEGQVSEIRRLYFEKGFSQNVLARRFNTCQSNISILVNRNGWTHVR